MNHLSHHETTLATNDSSENVGSVISLQAFREKKLLKGGRTNGLSDTFQASSQPPAKAGQSEPESDLAVRIERIKSSIHRINQLMTELRSAPNKEKPKS